MSVQALSWVLDNSPTTGSDRLVLISLANHATNQPPWECYPGIATIARESGIARPRTVQEALARLEANGHIERIINGATDARIRPDRRTNLYRIMIGVTESDTPCGVTDSALRGDGFRPDGVTESVTQTVIEPSVKPSEIEIPKTAKMTTITNPYLQAKRFQYPDLDIDDQLRKCMNRKKWAGIPDKQLEFEHWLANAERWRVEALANPQPQRKGVSRGPASRDPEAFLDPETLKRSNVRVFTD